MKLFKGSLVDLSIRPQLKPTAMPLMYSLSPSSLTQYYQSDQGFNPLNFDVRKPITIPNKRKKNELSPRAKRNLKKSMHWLSFLSRPRRATWSGVTKDKNYTLSFITLTLPAKQKHAHSEVTKRCLNLFFSNLRKTFGLSNYIWRAELQENGNIHYHVVIDVYIHYLAIRKYWNLALAKLGYLTLYANRFKDLSFEEYKEIRIKGGQTDIKKIRKAYRYGNSTHWLSPNTTDVHKTRNIKNVIGYICKYLTKDQKKTGNADYNKSLKALNGRLWFCSQSISRLKNVKITFNPNSYANYLSLKKLEKTYKKTFDYAECCYFNLGDLSIHLRGLFSRLLYQEAAKCGYQIP